jgi:hypothetical protein
MSPLAMATVRREKQFNVRMNPDDVRRFRTVASHYGLSITSVIRLLVKQEYDRLRRLRS